MTTPSTIRRAAILAAIYDTTALESCQKHDAWIALLDGDEEPALALLREHSETGDNGESVIAQLPPRLDPLEQIASDVRDNRHKVEAAWDAVIKATEVAKEASTKTTIGVLALADQESDAWNERDFQIEDGNGNLVSLAWTDRSSMDSTLYEVWVWDPQGDEILLGHFPGTATVFCF